MYRDINIEKALLQFVENDWQNSISLRYDIDANILKMGGAKINCYLSKCYSGIVLPMTTYLKKVMIYF